MAMLVSYFERRDAADRDAFGRAALNVCRANRARAGVRSSRFYWFNGDTVVIASDGESLDTFNGQPTPEQSVAFFALSDLARPLRMERWQDAGAGEQAYRASQSARR